MQNTKGFSIDDVEVLVLDEADRLLEMGFRDELIKIMSGCKNPKRQTLMLSATLNQDLKELAKLALQKPMQFSVDRQQKQSEIKNLKLTQYLVRLQLDGLTNYYQKFDEVRRVKDKKKNKKRLDPDHPDFDSEEEYGKESDDDPNDEPEQEEEEAEDEIDDLDDLGEEGEEEMVSMDGEEPKPAAPLVKKPRKEKEIKARTNKCDEPLAKREASLLTILSKSFRHRVIIFCNHKVQCTRIAILLSSYGLKVAEVHSNVSQTQRMRSVEQF